MNTADKVKKVRALFRREAQPFLGVSKGKLEVSGRGYKIAAAFTPAELEDLARAMLEATVEDDGLQMGWRTSSSMNWSDEYGWPTDSASNDLDKALTKVVEQMKKERAKQKKGKRKK